MHARSILIVLCVLSTGCTMGPDYRRPDITAPASWRLSDVQATEISNVAWWDQFEDPVLSQLVRTALANNLDLKIASANVDQAYAQYGITRSQLFPQVNADASASRQKQFLPPPLVAGPFNTFALDLSTSYEIDLWGRLRRATEAARASVLASEEGRRTVVMTLVSSVATGYIQLRALDKQLDIARSTLASRREVLGLQRARFQEGAAPESDYQQAESQLRTAAAQLIDLERLIAQQENFISVLLGENPHTIQRGRALDELAFPAVPGALPSSLLERRPDIRQAEQNLIAANADIGVARAAYFPAISLTGLLGLESTDLSDLFRSGARTWSLGGTLTQPIFNAGRIRNQVAQAEAIERQTLYQYRQSILNAFQDVENALVDRTKFSQARTEQAANVGALQRFRDLAEIRYKEGVTIYLELANAQDQLFNAQLAFTSTQSQLFQSYASLYRAMGGGWIWAAEATGDVAPDIVPAQQPQAASDASLRRSKN
jgi:multidrug efflux system outer membrane protein